VNLEITRLDARRAALEGLIDYAGLFPPASLDMAGAVAGFRRARTGPQAWMVRRFIVTASRLEELVSHLVPSMTSGEEPWRLSVVFDGKGWPDGPLADAAAVRTLVKPLEPAVTADLAEIRLPGDRPATPDEIAAVAAAADPAMALFEVPWQSQALMEEALATISAVRIETTRAMGAKIRCGGVTADAFPPAGAVAAFLLEAARHGLPVKATAGLHHPHRHTDPETGFTHHGFLNVLAASVLAAGRAAPDQVVAALLVEDPERLTLGPKSIEIDGEAVGADAVAGARRFLFMGYGSCSFDEPVADLTALGVLPL
jgi:hypothetical protein